MKISLISLTENGKKLSAEIAGKCHDFTISRYCFYTHSDENSITFSDIKILMNNIFSESDGIVFVCACGIAVRVIAPFLNSKAVDPAVIAIDDCGKFVIPILSGHIGGANALALEIAEKINAVPVITTATDIGKTFSPDSFAKANNLYITDLTMAKKIASAVLDNKKIGLISDCKCKNIPEQITMENITDEGIVISHYINKKPFKTTLNLVPENLVLGIGCKHGTDMKTIENVFSVFIEKVKILPQAIVSAASIDIKRNEKGLLEFCKKNNLKISFFSADELMKVNGNFTHSDFVLKTTGTDNVCERSAVLLSGGKLIAKKFALSGVTLALAEIPAEPDFERKLI